MNNNAQNSYILTQYKRRMVFPQWSFSLLWLSQDLWMSKCHPVFSKGAILNTHLLFEQLQKAKESHSVFHSIIAKDAFMLLIRSRVTSSSQPLIMGHFSWLLQAMVEFFPPVYIIQQSLFLFKMILLQLASLSENFSVCN